MSEVDDDFINAAKAGDLNTVQSLVDRVNINSKDSDGRTALWHAAYSNRLEVVRFLAARKDVDVNLANVEGVSPLHRAASMGQEAVVAVLLSNGADINQADNKGRSPLHEAASMGREAVVALLLSKGANIKQADNNGYSPLHEAALQGHDAMVAVLLSKEASINQADNDGESPLHRAARMGREAVVAVLLSKGADINQADNNGQFPLHLAASMGQEATVALLLSKEASINQADKYGYSPLHVAAQMGKEAVVALLLSKGADINQADNNGYSPLHVAARLDREAVVAVLLSKGSYINQTNTNGNKPIDIAKTQEIKDMLIAHAKQQQPQQPSSPSQTPSSNGQAPPSSNGQVVSTMVDELQWFQAAENGNLAVIQQGINDKIDVNNRDSKGRTAMWWAAQRGHIQLVEHLIAQHADLSIADVEGVSPLHRAASMGREAVVAVLVSNGADMNQTDNNGFSHLHHAALQGHDATVALLLSKGASINQADNNGQSPLHEAAQMGKEAVVAVLLSKGANINRVDNNSYSPLFYAAMLGQEAVVAVLLSNKADVNQATKYGQKPIDKAKTQKIKDMLIVHGAEEGEAQQTDQPVPTNEEKEQKTAIAARKQQEAKDALLLAATSNFKGLSSEQIGDLVVSFGDQYVSYRENIITMGLTGKIIALAMNNGTLHDTLKEVGLTNVLQLNTIEAEFQDFYQPTGPSTPVTSPTKEPAAVISFSDGDVAFASLSSPVTTPTATNTTATATTTKDSLSTAESVASLSNVSISFPPLTIIPWNEIQVESSRNSHLGKGSFGTVLSGKWKPIQLRNVDRVVAVKVMTRGFAKEEEYLRAVQCAKAEAQLIHNLCAQHGPAIGNFVMHVYGVAEGTLPPHLITAFNYFALPGEEGFGIVMSLAAGGTLSNLLHGGPPLRILSMLEKLSICAQLARGLTELHAVVTSLKIADFGTARVRGQLESTLGQSTLQRTGHIKGTPIYSAPEMMEEEEEEDEDDDDEEEGQTTGVARASRSTDSYALAIIMHEILTRKKPFEEIKTFKKLSKKVLKGGRPPIDKLPADTPDTVKDMIQRCWDGDREKRLSSYRCAEILARALPVFEQQQIVSRPTSAAIEPLSQTTLKRLVNAELAAAFEKFGKIQEEHFKDVHDHLDDLSKQLSKSLNSMGELLNELATASDANTKNGLAALLVALQTHQTNLANGQKHDQKRLEELVRTEMVGMEKTLSNQLQQCLKAVMKGTKNAANRDASANEKIDVLVSVVTDMKAEVTSLHTLSKQQHEMLQVIEKRSNLMPHTFIILPKLHPFLGKDATTISKMKNCLLRQKDRLASLVWEQSTLFFMCPITHKFVPCGPEGKGYPINMPRAWVRVLAPALQWGLFFLKIALAFQGLGGIVPDLPQEWLQQLNKALPGTDQLVKLQSVIDQITDDGVVVAIVGSDGGNTAMTVLEMAIETYVDWEQTEDEHAKSAFAQVFKFLAEAEEEKDGVSDRNWKPKYTGLHPTSPPSGIGSRSSSLWVSPEGVELFKKKGWDAMKSKLLRGQMLEGHDDDT